MCPLNARRHESSRRVSRGHFLRVNLRWQSVKFVRGGIWHVRDRCWRLESVYFLNIPGALALLKSGFR